jgi:hypothetical protein
VLTNGTRCDIIHNVRGATPYKIKKMGSDRPLEKENDVYEEDEYG